MEDVTKQIGETTYTLKLFPTMTGLSIVTRLEALGTFTPEIIFEVVTKGAGIGSTVITEKKFNEHFRGRYGELMELFAEVLKHNKMFPEDEGNAKDSDE